MQVNGHISTGQYSGPIESKLQRLKSNFNDRRFAKTKQEQMKEKFHLDLTGRALPAVMTQSNIQRTQENRLANLLSIQYCRQYPTVFFVKG